MTPIPPVLRIPRPSRVTSYVGARLGPAAIPPEVVRTVLGCFALEERQSPRNLRLNRRSLNAAVTTSRGTKVVKQYRPEWSAATVAYGHSILTRLEELDFPAVRLERTPDAQTMVELDGRVYAVFDFVPGTNYSLNYLLRSQRLALTAIAGRTLGSMHRALRDFEPVGSHHLGLVSATGPRRRDVAWHRAKVDELVERSASLAEPPASERAEELARLAPSVVAEIDRLDAVLSGADLLPVVIHGDYGPHNLLYRRGAAVVVDFEVARLDWRVNDLASALGKYRYRGGEYDFESMRTFLSAYAQVFPLAPNEQQAFVDAWRLYKLQAAVQYWNGYFETNGPVRKLASAIDSIEQAEWVAGRPETVQDLAHLGGGERQ